MSASGYVIVPAAGCGTRMKSKVKKQFLALSGTPILVRTLKALASCENTLGIIVVGAPEDLETLAKMTRRLKKISAIVPGGATRQESVLCGLRALPEEAELVAVHDGVRPFVTAKLLAASFEAASECGACVCAVPVTDTVKRADAEQNIAETPARSTLYAAQTPQTFRTAILREAYEKAASAGDFTLTDDASAVEKYGTSPVKIIPGDPDNIKITAPADLALGKSIIKRQRQ